MFFLIWPLALFLLLNNREDRFIRWFSGYLLVGGGGAVYYFAAYLLEKGPEASESHTLLLEVSRGFIILLMILYYYFLPYLFMGMSMTLFKKSKKLNVLNGIVLFVSILFVCITRLYPTVSIHMDWLRYWAGACFILGVVFLIAAFKKETHTIVRRNIRRLMILLLPITALIYFNAFWSIREISYEGLHLSIVQRYGWTINMSFVDLWILLCFLVYSVKYGFLGIKLKVEKHRMEASLRAMTKGTTIMNHAIKNELQKAAYLNEKLKESHQGDPSTLQTLEKMSKVHEQMLSMVQRINTKTNDVPMDEKEISLTSMIDETLDSLDWKLRENGIIVRKEITVDFELCCDEIHLREVFSNLVSNAIEAMTSGEGKLNIRIYRSSGEAVIEIEDTGKGIGKESLPYIFDPFYTTKNFSTNFGLGLSHAYTVITRHGGDLRIAQSKPGIGTIFVVRLPKRRITKWTEVTEWAGSTYDQNKGYAR